jgi:Fic family protein
METRMEVPPNYLDMLPLEWAAVIEALERMDPDVGYPHWEEVRCLSGTSEMDRRALWAALKLTRMGRLRPLELTDGLGRPYSLAIPETVIDAILGLERLEREFGGVTGWEPVYAKALREEAVGSAMLAGGTTNPTEANEMLREDREAGDEGSRMIRACHRVLQGLPAMAGAPLTQERLFEIQRQLLDGMPGAEDAAGRFRGDSDPVRMPQSAGGADRLSAPAGHPDRMEKVLAFANGLTPAFPLPALIRAIVLHFWVAHNRPFPEANGRAARALFYWTMLHEGYASIRFLAISPLLLQEGQRYADTFLQTETDGNDLTYFVLHQAATVRAAGVRWRERVRGKLERLREAGRRWRGFSTLNARQQALVDHALRRPQTRYIITGHQRSHGITHQTARDDLFDLVNRNLLEVTRERRVYHFRAVPDLADRLQSASLPRPGPSRSEPEEMLPTSLL